MAAWFDVLRIPAPAPPPPFIQPPQMPQSVAELTPGDYVFVTIFSVVIGAFFVFALQKLGEGLLLSYKGLAKLLDYLHKTYLVVWEFSLFVLRLAIFLIVAGIVFYFVAGEEQKRIAYDWSVRAAPTIQFVANKTIEGVSSLQKLHRHYIANGKSN